MNRRLFLVFITIGLSFFSCHRISEQTAHYLRLQGSDTMYLLALRWAEAFMKENPGVSLYVEGGGTAKGFHALINGQVDICAASRPMLPHEVRLLAEHHQRLGIAHMVAKDALSIYLHPSNPVISLTFDQLRKIFTGEIKNWQEVGGADLKISVFIRSANSGTYAYFKEHVLTNRKYTTSAQIRFSNQAVADAVFADPSAIGYGGTAYGENVKHCPIDGIAPTIENVLADKYAISRYLYLYTLDTPRGLTNEFITWIMDRPGQVIVAKTGFIPIFNSAK